MNRRIYEVASRDESVLVEATSASQALRLVAEPRYTVSVPNTMRVAELFKRGAKVIEGPAERPERSGGESRAADESSDRLNG